MLKNISLYFSAASLRIILFFGLTIVCFVLIATNPTHIKNIINDTGIYKEFVPAVIEDTVKKQPESIIVLTDPAVKDAINSSFVPKTLQKNTEILIDQSYAWLDGENKDLVFKIDLTAERQQAADRIAKIAFDRIKTLPVCFAIPETFDPFTVGCQPPLTDLAAEEKKLSELIASDTGILPKTIYTNADLPKNNEGKYIYEKYSNAPTIYKWLKYSPYIIGLLIVIFSVLTVILSRTRRDGLKRLGSIFIGSGITLIITPILLSFILPNISKNLSFSTPNNNSVSTLTSNLMNTISNDFYNLLLNISIQVLVVGASIFLIEKITRPKSKYSEASFKSGMVSSHTKKPSTNNNYKPDNIPLQSSEESTRRKPKKTRNKKYRKIPGKGEK